MSRIGRGKSKKTLKMVDAAVEILDEIQPASVRAVCYRLFVAGVTESMLKNETNKVSRNLVWAREQNIIPWHWIVDETREAERAATWSDPKTIIDAAVRGYRRDYWQDQPRRVEVWAEKGTIRGTLAPVLREYGVTLRVMHGYSSATAIKDAAEYSLSCEKPLTILYAGDFDPSGLHMSHVDLPERLSRYGGLAEIKRIALTQADVDRGDLPSFGAATKTKDPRHKWFISHFGQTCWELDAMPPPELRDRVEIHIRRYLDLEAWDHAQSIEQVEVESMQSIMGRMDSILRQASKYSGEGNSP
jgi:hypothetical protein